MKTNTRISHRTRKQRKIKYRWKSEKPLPEKKKKRKRNLKRFPLASIFLSSRLASRGGFISSRVGKSVFHIFLSTWNNKIVSSSASYDVVANVCGNVWSVFYLLDKVFHEQKTEMTMKAVKAIKSKHLCWHESDTRDRNQTTIFFQVVSVSRNENRRLFSDGGSCNDDNKMILLSSGTVSTQP